jgi:hypothetical protein
MSHRRVYIRLNLGLAAGLLSISLVLGGLHLPLGHRRAADLNLDKVYRLASLTSVALAKGRHVANDLSTLYRIHQLTSPAPQPATPPAPDSAASPLPSSTPVEICSNVFHGPARRSSN